MGQQFFVNEDNKSIGVFLAGSIEYWWDRPEDMHRFESPEAVAYREWRDHLREWLAGHGFISYAPHRAFYGPWDEAMQEVNDFAIKKMHIFVDMTPVGVPMGKGTKHELYLAADHNRVLIWLPPTLTDDQLEKEMERAVQLVETKRVTV